MHISGELREQYIGAKNSTLGGKKQYIGASGRLSNAAVTQKPPKRDFEPAKQDSGSAKPDYESAKQDFVFASVIVISFLFAHK